MDSSKKKAPSRFSFGCEVFHKDIEFNENDELSYIDQFKFNLMAQVAQHRVLELDALRSGYQQIMDAYKDLYQRYHGRHLLSSYCEHDPMRLGELQAQSLKKKKQLLFSIEKMLKVQTSENTTLNFDKPLFKNKWFFRRVYKLELINKMPEGKEKEKEAAKFWWSIEEGDCFATVFGEEVKEYIKNMIDDAQPDQIMIRPTENPEGEQQENISGSKKMRNQKKMTMRNQKKTKMKMRM